MHTYNEVFQPLTLRELDVLNALRYGVSSKAIVKTLKRRLAEPILNREVQKGNGTQDSRVFNIHENPSTGPTQPYAAKIELCKRSKEITISTVNVHLSSVMEKLHIYSRKNLCAFVEKSSDKADLRERCYEQQRQWANPHEQEAPQSNTVRSPKLSRKAAPIGAKRKRCVSFCTRFCFITVLGGSIVFTLYGFVAQSTTRNMSAQSADRVCCNQASVHIQIIINTHQSTIKIHGTISDKRPVAPNGSLQSIPSMTLLLMLPLQDRKVRTMTYNK